MLKIILLSLFLIFGSTTPALAVTYYVSPNGNDNNSGTSSSSPFKTIPKAINVATGGDTIELLPGTYPKLSITKSGPSPSNRITLKGPSSAIINGSGANKGFNVDGSNWNFEGFTVAEAVSHGVHIQGKNVDLTSLIVRNNVTENRKSDGSCGASGGWGSGLSIKVGAENILVKDSRVYHNCGEGIAITRGINVTVRNNVVYDNYSVNIYLDNSRNVTAEQNLSFCNPNTGFERSGTAASAYAIGQEVYSGWGAQLSNLVVKNNISMYCNRGLIYYGNDTGQSGTNILPSTIANNTFWGSANSAISILSLSGDNFHNGLKIANNIVQQPSGKLIYIENPSGITITHNFWVGNSLPSSSLRGTNYQSGDPLLLGTPNRDPSSYRLSANSPAINRGTALSGITNDFAGTPRPQGGALDIGAYEHGSSDTSPPSPSPQAKPGDLNSDGVVNLFDFNLLISRFGNPYTIFDFNDILRNFGK